jgi:hypothetical protein
MTEEENRKKRTDINVQIENKTEIGKDELWNSVRREVQEKYARFGISFDASQIHDKEGLDQNIEILKGLEGKKKAEEKQNPPKGGDTENFYSQGQQTGKAETLKNVDSDMPISWLEFEDEKEMISTLNRLKREGSPEQRKQATVALSKLEKKAFSKSSDRLDIEFEGNLRDLSKRCLPIKEGMTEEEKQRIQAYNESIIRKRTAWKNKNGE